MTKDSKDNIAVVSACVMLLIGAGLTVAGFCVPPVGEVSGSVLSLLGECLVYAGSIFGVKLYFDNRLEAFEQRIKSERK